MSNLSSVKPVKPRTICRLFEEQTRILDKALSAAENRHSNKAAKLFESLAEEMRGLDQDIATDAASMKANASLMMGKMEFGRNRELAESYLDEALKHIDEALKPDPYWADYVSLEDKIRHFVHREFGCRIARQGGLWRISCIDVSNALGILGISRSEKFDLECSICGKDPMFCAHIPGEVYNGRLALEVVKNLEIEHFAFMTDGIPEERHVGILPRPLTDGDIKNFFSEGRARQILSKGEMRCKDLIRVIRQRRLGGMNFVEPSSR